MEGSFVGRREELHTLREAVTRGRGAVVIGAAGVGKTRLVREAVHGVVDATRWMSVTRETGTIPFGAFMTLAPELTEEFTAPGAALAGFGLVRRAVVPDSGSAVLVVDDGHLLDPASSAAVHHLVVTEALPVVVIGRAGETAPQAITSLWRDETLPRVEVGPLPRGDADILATTMLGAAADVRTLERLWNLSRGNALELRELILAAEDGDALRDINGVRSLSDDFSPTTRLVDLVEDRMGRLDGDELMVAEAVAYGEPLHLELLLHVADPAVVERMERSGVITVDATDPERVVMLGHPLYGEVLRAGLPMTRRAVLAAGLAEGAVRAGLPGLDPLRVATWRMEAGTADADELATAARDAVGRMAYPTALRLAAASLDAKESYTAHTVMGAALAELGEVERAEHHLVRAREIGESRLLRAWAVISLADLWFFHAERLEEALDLVRTEAATEPDPEIREHLVGALAVLSMMYGDLGEVRALAAEALGGHDPSSRARLLGLVATSLVEGLAMRPKQVRAAVREAMPLTEENLPTFPNAGDVLTAGLLIAGAAEGDIVTARTTLDERRSAALHGDTADLPGFWGVLHGQLLLYEGRARDSLAALKEALVLLERFDSMLSRPLALVEAAHAAAVLGDLDEARSLLGAVPESARVTPRVRSRFDHVDAIVAASDGLETAARRARAAGDRAAADDHLLWAVEAWHLATRFGHPEVTLERLGESAESHPATIARLYADHGEALVVGDAAGLEGVASRFMAAGMPLHAAETAAQAADAHRRSGHGGRGRRASAMARNLLPPGSGARTPALLGLSDIPPLTKREREVALLAAGGKSSRSIAEALGLSVRTVDNHLGRIYAKVGARNRDQLAEVLGTESLR